MTPLQVYQKHLSNLKHAYGDEYKTNCPFHDDKTPSFYINSISGFYHCLGCGAGGGLFGFLEKIGKEEDKTELPNFIDIGFTKKPNLIKYINPLVVQQLHKNLLSDKSKLQYVLRERKISFFVI